MGQSSPSSLVSFDLPNKTFLRDALKSLVKQLSRANLILHVLSCLIIRYSQWLSVTDLMWECLSKLGPWRNSFSIWASCCKCDISYQSRDIVELYEIAKMSREKTRLHKTSKYGRRKRTPNRVCKTQRLDELMVNSARNMDYELIPTQ